MFRLTIPLLLLIGCTDYSKPFLSSIEINLKLTAKDQEQKEDLLSKQGLFHLKRSVYSTCLSENYRGFFVYEDTFVCYYRERYDQVLCKAMAVCIK